MNRSIHSKYRRSFHAMFIGVACCVCVILSAPLVFGTDAAAKPGSCPIIPTPKSYRDLGKTAVLEGPGTAAIVLGNKATEPEIYAAERLQTLLYRRFRKVVPVRQESECKSECKSENEVAGLSQVFLLGQRSTNAWLDRLCTSAKVELNDKTPGDDGFVIECIEEPGRRIVLVGGGNPRGVLYGQFALFDLFRKEKDEVVFTLASVRDRPSIAWRGRPHSVLRQHLVPGAMDAYAWSRLNFTDVRDNPHAKATYVFPARKASMGFPAGVSIDRPTTQRVIDGAHRRGMFVYGTVSCAVKKNQCDIVVQTFEDLVGMDVEGLWLSFDDTGAGEDPVAVIARVVALGKEHGMTGRRLAVTPPDRSYQYIDKPFNRLCAAVPGIEDAEWFFTRVPCKEDVETTRQIGLRRLPGWWHNLVEFRGGFLHNGDVACPMFADDRPGYLNLQPLSSGWHMPDYERLRDAEKYTDHVLLWGVVGGWPEEYEMAALGIWAWNPAAHEWAATRRAIYGFVHGPSQANTAAAFDDTLAKLKDLFHLPVWHYAPNKGWPCRLKNTADRPKALALIAELEKQLEVLQAKAPGESCLEPARLQGVYLEPMRQTLIFARKMTLLDYPEYAFGDLDKRMLGLINAGKKEEAAKLLAEARPEVDKRLLRVTEELEGLKGIREWASFWRTRMAGMEYWEAKAAKKHAK